MQVANADTVLGDFSRAQFDYFGATTEFFVRDGKFIVRTGNAEGETEDFPVTHTFGVAPLQQYLVDTSSGRKQALPIAWDTRPAEDGGQRWYHLYPEEDLKPGDELHWTGRYFNWNVMCAECHSTNVDVTYDATDDSFATTFSEVSVGCEACHGPGSLHIAMAISADFDDGFGLPTDLNDRNDSAWIMNPDTGIAALNAPAARQQQPEACGRCHSRRSVLTLDYEYGKPLTDTHMPSLLQENLYHADGRILEEVYVYGSFLQSKMYAAGVTCTDCHNPHSGRLVTGDKPSDVCAQCHLPAKFATQTHAGGSSTDCVACHMPTTTYMGVDDRHDHSIRIPDAGSVDTHYGAAIEAGRIGQANPMLLKSLQTPATPAIARATMLTLMAPPPTADVAAALQSGLNDPDPLVRIGALRALRRQPAELRAQIGSDLLRDPIRGVRVEAAQTYVEIRDLLPLENARAFADAADDYRNAMMAAGPMPESITQLAEFESTNGNFPAARRLFERAIYLDSKFAFARHAFGLFLVRSGERDRALEELRQAMTLDPRNARYTYVYAVALNSTGRSDDAIELLTDARGDFPLDFDIAWALLTMLRDRGELGAARSLGHQMTRQFPNRPNIELLLRSME